MVQYPSSVLQRTSNVFAKPGLLVAHFVRLGWYETSTKQLQRCHIWQDRQIGLRFHVNVYDVLAVTSLAYTAQLERPPHATVEAENARAACPYQGSWRDRHHWLGYTKRPLAI